MIDMALSNVLYELIDKSIPVLNPPPHYHYPPPPGGFVREEVREGEPAVCLMLPLKGLSAFAHTNTHTRKTTRPEGGSGGGQGRRDDTPRGGLLVRRRPYARL